MAVASVNASREGKINGSYEPVWVDARDQPTGQIAYNYTTPTTDPMAISVEYVSSRAGDLYRVIRPYFYWDLSAYAGTITNIDLNIDLVGSGTPLQIQPAVSVLAFSGNGGAPLVASEFDINVPTPPSPPVYSASPFLNGGGIVTTTLNGTAIADANANGFLIIQLDEYDFDWKNIDPTPFGYMNYYAGIVFANGTNTLDVTYTAGYANEVNNVAGASISEVNNVAGASISEIMNT